jgi:hypothetical protein
VGRDVAVGWLLTAQERGNPATGIDAARELLVVHAPNHPVPWVTLVEPGTRLPLRPVTNPTDTPAGRPSSSASHPPATSSTTLAAGPRT